MPEPAQLAKAELREISWDSSGQATEVGGDTTVVVQFNPASLKVSFSNQAAGSGQPGGSAVQYVGKGTTKLALELWFDSSLPLADGSEAEDGDVRRLTQKVAYFITPVEESEGKYLPPGVRLVWGTFLFDGIMDSLNETLEHFSEEGRPLRASVQISLTQQEIQFKFNPAPPPGSSPGEAAAGTTPQSAARAGDSVQSMAARAGKVSDWKAIASANGIDDPLRVGVGVSINVNVSVKR